MSSASTDLRDPRPVAAMAARGRHRLVRRALRWTAALSVASAMVVGVTTPAQAAGATYIGAAGGGARLAGGTRPPPAGPPHSEFNHAPPPQTHTISLPTHGTRGPGAAGGRRLAGVHHNRRR